jgi:hypothetical protein
MRPKPIDELTADDLLEHPIWEYAMDCEEDGDETFVRPVHIPFVPKADHNVYHVACELTLATGKIMTGFMSIYQGQLHHSAPVAVGSGGDYWPLDEKPSRGEISKHKTFFGASYKGIFPIQWCLLASVKGKPDNWSGSYAGG